MRPVVIGRVFGILFITVSLIVIVPWLRYRPLKDLDPEIAMSQPPPPQTKSFALSAEGVVYSKRGTIPQEPLIFGPFFIGSLGSFAFLIISLLIGRRPEG